MKSEETLEGHIVDMACLRKYPRDEMAARAREHTTERALMGHCIESGYGLVHEDGRISPLDAKATTEVVRALRDSSRAEGVRLRVHRREEGGEMKTWQVKEIV